MKKLLLLSIVALAAIIVQAGAMEKGALLQKRSLPFGTYPKPFTYLNASNPTTYNTHNAPAISTGYYFVDDNDPADAFWKPIDNLADTNVRRDLWVRIASGPRQTATSNHKADWQNFDKNLVNDPMGGGFPFFRNPAIPANPRNFFTDGVANATDSTDDAIAGPIPIKLNNNFIFNGIRYDSFYVSTNGVIALSNRRYTYNQSGNRAVISGTTCYDPQSMDWYAGTVSKNGGAGSENRARLASGDGTTDPILDNFGYNYSVLGGQWDTLYSPSSLAGIRARVTGGGALNSNPAYKGAYIAPFWGDNQVSVFYASKNFVDNWGKVYYGKDSNGKILTIYYVNLQPISNGTQKATRIQPYTANRDIRPGEANYIDCSAQVRLNTVDSSITVIYEKFTGSVPFGYSGVVFGPEVFRYNSVCGVRGFARHTNFNRNASYSTTVPEYEQYTTYYDFDRIPGQTYPAPSLRVRFKQWLNSLIVLDIQYRVRVQDPNASADFTVTVPSDKVNNYEILAGESQIGAVQPVAIIENLSNDVQGPLGVNYVKQDLTFQARFRIINQASNRIVYNRLVPVDDKCLKVKGTIDTNGVCTGDPSVRVRYAQMEYKNSTYAPNAATPYPAYPATLAYSDVSRIPQGNITNGIPVYEYVQLFFPPWEPNELALDFNNKPLNIGRMRSYIIADPTRPTGDKYGDSWPYDDTGSVQLFVMKRLSNFNDDVTEYHIIGNAAMPSVYKWVNIEADVVSGDAVSRFPMPPRGQYIADNNPNDKKFSPVIHMNRKMLTGVNPSPLPGGDELRSFPIDLRGKKGSVISLNIQRTQNQDTWDRGYGDGSLVGPEPRSVTRSNTFNRFTTGLAASDNFDELQLDIAVPPDNKVAGITNLTDAQWRFHPRRGGAATELAVPAFSLFGAGGYRIGFLETDRDSALKVEDANTGSRHSLRANLFDDGIDFEYQKFYVTIPDTFIRWKNEGAKNIRFRLRCYCRDDNKGPIYISDDDDDFYVDNVRVLYNTSEVTDLEVSSTRIVWPYINTPATQATNIPVWVRVSNNTNLPAPHYEVRTRIFKDYSGRGRAGDPTKPVYCRNEVVPAHNGNIEQIIKMPAFNARETGPGKYRMISNTIYYESDDLEPKNDTNYTDFELKFSNDFAYDPGDSVSGSNDVPSFVTTVGKGLCTEGYAFGGTHNFGSPNAYDEALYGTGYIGGSISGQIAMKFELLSADTIYGFKAMFGTANQSPDAIGFSLYSGGASYQNNRTPGQLINNSTILRQRGEDYTGIHGVFDNKTYTNYRLDKPIILPVGVYWMSIAQLGQTGLELGASKSRMGMRTIDVDYNPNNPITGATGTSLVLHKEFRRVDGLGVISFNNNVYALENTKGSGNWLEFMPNAAAPAYGHLHHFGVSPIDGATQTLTRGTWAPAIRPFLGIKSFSTEIKYIDCEWIPVELASFDGNVRGKSIDLYWQTASERDNAGFYIEKRAYTEEENASWDRIPEFIKGAGTTSLPQYYNYNDAAVQAGGKYQYRLVQVDRDGSQSCHKSNVVTMQVGTSIASMELLQNMPNPLVDNTTINFNISNSANVKLEIVDMMGNVVKTLENGLLTAGPHSSVWNATNSNDEKVGSGTYIYRLTAGDETQTQKMTVVR